VKVGLMGLISSTPIENIFRIALVILYSTKKKEGNFRRRIDKYTET